MFSIPLFLFFTFLSVLFPFYFTVFISPYFFFLLLLCRSFDFLVIPFFTFNQPFFSGFSCFLSQFIVSLLLCSCFLSLFYYVCYFTLFHVCCDKIYILPSIPGYFFLCLLYFPHLFIVVYSNFFVCFPRCFLFG